MDAATLLIELGAVLLVLTVAARLSGRLGLSPIPLYLIVGLLLGEGGLVPLVTATGFIEQAAQIGVVLLLLMLGLEYSPQELASGLRSNLSLVGVDFVTNALPGVVAALALGWGPQGAAVLGGVTYISSSGIVAKVVDELGWFANRETSSVLSLLVAEDLVMAVYLPVLSAVLVGGTTGSIVTGILAGVGAAVLALVVATKFGPQLSQALLTPSNEALLLGVLGATLLVAGLAERVHVSAAVGAFLVGIAFSGPAQERSRVLLLPLRDIFAASFFVLFGLSVDPRSIPPVLLVALTLAVVTAATKHLTAWWAGRVAGFGTAARRRAGAVLTARGEFSIVIAEIGVAAGLHDQLGPLATAYVLVLAITSPVLARFARSGAAPLRRAGHRPSTA